MMKIRIFTVEIQTDGDEEYDLITAFRGLAETVAIDAPHGDYSVLVTEGRDVIYSSTSL